MKVTERLRKDADYIWREIFNHPFVIELFEGSLPEEKFKYYIIQDYNYLITTYRCFSLIASKAEYEIARKSLEYAYIDATLEIDNYNKLLKNLGLEINDVTSIEPSPTNMAYMNFLISICSLKPSIEGLTALLPCFWSYMEIADVNNWRLEKNRNKLYIEWINVYRSKEYRNMISDLRNLVDRYGSSYNYNRLRKIFIVGSKYEYMFWDMAYKMEEWPV